MILTYYVLMCDDCPATDSGDYGSFFGGQRTAEQDNVQLEYMANEHPDNHSYTITVNPVEVAE